MNKIVLNFLLLFVTSLPAVAQEDLLMNVGNRNTISLNGTSNYIVDPYETGFYNYRYRERKENDPEAYWNRPVVEKPTDRVEHGYQEPYTIEVPGDWNSQDDIFKYYEGTVWYQREFDLEQLEDLEKIYLHFGAVNYEAHVYLNGKKLGSHKGGFTPFNFEIPKEILREEDNFLVVKVDNKRQPQEIPTVNTDWWNFGGITRDVQLVLVPETFIQQYALHLDQDQDILKSKDRERFELEGQLKLNQKVANSNITVEIPELRVKEKVQINGDNAKFDFQVRGLELWSPENPKLYDVIFRLNGEELRDRIGFRKIETSGKDILLNGEEIFLRGKSIHEEIPQDMRRAKSKEDAEQLFSYVQDLNPNMVRLAHYPHNEHMSRMADSFEIIVWSEIPVHWAIDFTCERVLEKEKNS